MSKEKKTLCFSFTFAFFLCVIGLLFFVFIEKKEAFRTGSSRSGVRKNRNKYLEVGSELNNVSLKSNKENRIFFEMKNVKLFLGGLSRA